MIFLALTILLSAGPAELLAPFVRDDDAVVESLFQGRLIGLGEATHGTREFYDERRRITMMGIKKYGVRVVLFEAGMAAVEDANAYIKNGTGTIEAATKSVGSTHGIRDLLVALRNWNATHPKKQVRLAGVDPKGNGPYIDIIRRWMSSANPKRLKALEPTIKMIPRGSSKLNPALVDAVIPLQTLLNDVKARGAPPSVVRAARALWQHANVYHRDLADAIDRRDAAMAFNAMDALGSDKGVLWAHNGHVSTGQILARPAMGVSLREALGRRYRALALVFSEGGFLAAVHGASAPHSSVGFIVPAAPPENVGGVLAAVGPDRFMLDLKSLTGDAKALLEKTRLIRAIGSTYHESWTGTHRSMAPTSLVRDYDAVLFLRRVSEARSL